MLLCFQYSTSMSVTLLDHGTKAAARKERMAVGRVHGARKRNTGEHPDGLQTKPEAV